MNQGTNLHEEIYKFLVITSIYVRIQNWVQEQSNLRVRNEGKFINFKIMCVYVCVYPYTHILPRYVRIQNWARR